LPRSSHPAAPHPRPAHPQVNAGATCLLYHLAGTWAAPSRSTLLLDVCCGTGTIGISLAARVKAVVGIDNVASAIEDARANAALNGVANATWVCGPAEKVIDRVLEGGGGVIDRVLEVGGGSSTVCWRWGGFIDRVLEVGGGLAPGIVHLAGAWRLCWRRGRAVVGCVVVLMWRSW
jgi:SAM-dependent methyltransferase